MTTKVQRGILESMCEGALLFSSTRFPVSVTLVAPGSYALLAHVSEKTFLALRQAQEIQLRAAGPEFNVWERNPCLPRHKALWKTNSNQVSG